MTRRTTLLAALALAAVWATQFALLAPTNFTRTDEWLYVSLTSRGIVDCPHMQRPLALLWALPGALLRHRFIGFHLTDGAYVLLSGGLVFLLARRLSGDVLLALLAGVFALVWAPRDMNRLVTVQATVAAGPTFATVLAFVLLVESWVSGRRLLLALAGAVAFVTVRSYEATAALMLGGPLLVVWMAGGRSRRAWAWAGAFGAVVVFAVALTALFLRRPEASYQFALGFDPRPGAVLGRLGLQFGLHLLPLVTPPPGLGARAVGVAVAVFALGYAFVAASYRRDNAGNSPRLPRRGDVAGLAALGALLAALGYLPFCLLSSIQSATRTQFLSGRESMGSGLPDSWWFRPDGRKMARRDWESDTKTIGLFLNGEEIPTPNRRGERVVDESFLLLLNASPEGVTYRLPPRRFGGRWKLELSSASPEQTEGEEPSYAARAELEVAALSVVLLRRAW